MSQVYALDARNHGNSDHVTHMDYALMSRDTMQFCKEHQLDRVSLIGIHTSSYVYCVD